MTSIDRWLTALSLPRSAGTRKGWLQHLSSQIEGIQANLWKGTCPVAMCASFYLPSPFETKSKALKQVGLRTCR